MIKELFYEGNTIYSAVNDIVFKAIFAKEENKDLLCSLLKAYLDLDTTPEDLELLNTELSPNFIEGKQSRLDLRIKTDSGDHINIEIQVRDEQNIEQRSLFYVSNLYGGQLMKGEDYKKLGRAVGLNILCYTTKGNKRFLRNWSLHDRETLKPVSDGLEIVFVELPNAKNEKLNGLQDHWTTFLNPMDAGALKNLLHADAVFEKAVDTLVCVSKEEKIRFAMEMRRKAELDEAAREARLREKYTINRDELLAEGREEGTTHAKKEMVRRALKKGLDISTIASIASLTEQEVEKIKSERDSE